MKLGVMDVLVLLDELGGGIDFLEGVVFVIVVFWNFVFLVSLMFVMIYSVESRILEDKDLWFENVLVEFNI